MVTRFRNRTEAGQLLAEQLLAYRDRPDVLVLGLPRGGVPVAYEIARALHLPLDICLVRKLGTPRHPELAMGAIASGNVRVLNRDVLQSLHISPEALEQTTQREERELQRRDRCYRGEQPLPVVQDRVVILVDDGLATGSTMRAAITTLRTQNPREIVVAVPLAPASLCRELAQEVDRLVCLLMPESFQAIGFWYDNFTQTTDEEVRQLLGQVARYDEVDYRDLSPSN